MRFLNNNLTFFQHATAYMYTVAITHELYKKQI